MAWDACGASHSRAPDDMQVSGATRELDDGVITNLMILAHAQSLSVSALRVMHASLFFFLFFFLTIFGLFVPVSRVLKNKKTNKQPKTACWSVHFDIDRNKMFMERQELYPVVKNTPA